MTEKQVWSKKFFSQLTWYCNLVFDQALVTLVMLLRVGCV